MYDIIMYTHARYMLHVGVHVHALHSLVPLVVQVRVIVLCMFKAIVIVCTHCNNNECYGPHGGVSCPMCRHAINSSIEDTHLTSSNCAWAEVLLQPVQMYS